MNWFRRKNGLEHALTHDVGYLRSQFENLNDRLDRIEYSQGSLEMNPLNIGSRSIGTVNSTHLSSFPGTQVKIFGDRNSGGLENSINNYLKENPTVDPIEISISAGVNGAIYAILIYNTGLRGYQINS